MSKVGTMPLKISQAETKDPIGVELVLAILSLGISCVSAAHQFGWIGKNDKKQFRKMKELVLSVMDELDNLVLIFHRHQSYSQSTTKQKPESQRISIRETMMDLQERDYHRFNSIRHAVNSLTTKLGNVLSALRQAEIEIGRPAELLKDQELFHVFDDLLLNFSNLTIPEFVGRLRTALDALNGKLSILSGVE